MSVYVALLCFFPFCLFVCFFENEATAIGVNSKEVHDIKYSEMLNSPFHRMITSSLDIT